MFYHGPIREEAFYFLLCFHQNNRTSNINKNNAPPLMFTVST
nr:MAG TPA: hypothetical protein [Caudoviricetes sp.]